MRKLMPQDILGYIVLFVVALHLCYIYLFNTVLGSRQ